MRRSRRMYSRRLRGRKVSTLGVSDTPTSERSPPLLLSSLLVNVEEPVSMPESLVALSWLPWRSLSQLFTSSCSWESPSNLTVFFLPLLLRSVYLAFYFFIFYFNSIQGIILKVAIAEITVCHTGWFSRSINIIEPWTITQFTFKQATQYTKRLR